MIEYFKGKKILLLAPNFFDLRKQIEDELLKLGADVDYLEDILFKSNPKWIKGRILALKKIYFKIGNFNRKRIKSFVKENSDKKYDIFLCVNGFSFDQYIVDYYKSINSDLVRILYLWDSCDYFNFVPTFQYFDKVFTFDRKDSIEKGIIYLPLFWVPSLNCNNKLSIDLFFVGSLHSDRYSVLKKCISSTKGSVAYIKLYVKKECYIILLLKYFCALVLMDSELLLNIKVYLKKIRDSFITHKPISSADFDYYMSKSRCVLDISLPSQTGISNRMIAALASGKKVLTTNSDVIYTKFYDPNRILIIDRSNPVIPIEFVNKDAVEASSTINDALLELRIDNWLKTLLC